MLVENNREKHPDKTFIFQIEKDFKFPEYLVTRKELRLARQNVVYFMTRLIGRCAKENGPKRAEILGYYVRFYKTIRPALYVYIYG